MASFGFGPSSFSTPPSSSSSSNGFRFGSTTSSAPAFSFSASNDKTMPTSTPPTSTPTPTPTPTEPSSEPKAASLADGIDGVVAFPSRANESFRFEMVAKDAHLHIWLEDRKTKKQWCTAQLGLQDFVKDGLEIPGATFDDYAKCFVNCLEASSTTEADFTRDLVAPKGTPDAWELQLTLKIRVFTTTWTPTYSFLLKPVPLEPVDLLAAKIRDQEDQIAHLTRQVDSLNVMLKNKGKNPSESPLFVRATIGSQVSAGKLVWRPDGLSGKIVFHSSGAIRFNIGGTFAINIMVQNTNSTNGAAVDLLMNGKTVVSCVDSNPSGHHHISPIYHVVTVSPEDEIVVTYRGNNHAYSASYIVIHELR